MNSEEETDRDRRLLRYNEFLPYAAELEDEAKETFKEIKSMIASCLSVAEIRPGFTNWLPYVER